MSDTSVDYTHVTSEEFRNQVYCPSDDTFLFVDALQLDVAYIRTKDIAITLEIGCGSGYISTFLLKLLKGNAKQRDSTKDGRGTKSPTGHHEQVPGSATISHVPLVLTVDINRTANVATLETARRNTATDKMETITMDMFASLRKKRAQQMVDIIMFNPPYVPSNDDEQLLSDIDLAWNGGHRGREVIDRFVHSVGDYLSQDGTVYLLLEKRNQVTEVLDMIRQHGFLPKESEMELRLCDYLRVQAPHIFERVIASPRPSRSPSNSSLRRHRAIRPPKLGVPGDGVDAEQEYQYHRSSDGRPNSKVIWKGQLARNGSKLMDTAAVAITGDCESVLTSNLALINITHRLKHEEASRCEPIAVFYLRSQHSRETEAIDEYIKYFQEKERIGVATLDENVSIYICAPGTGLYEQFCTDLNHTNILICIVIPTSSGSQTPAAPSPSGQFPEAPQGDTQNWLSQLNKITSMLGAQ